MRGFATIAVAALLAGGAQGQAPAAPDSSLPVYVPPTGKVAGPKLDTVRPLRPKTPAVDPANPEAPVNGVVILYGNQKCPTNAAGEEVVVCARRSAAEQFRIPRELRDGTLKPEYESFALRGQALTDAARTGVGACEPTGAGGGTACTLAEYNSWKKQKDAQKAADKR